MDTPLRIVVSGATGFIGSHVVPALSAAGQDVAVVSRQSSASSNSEVKVIIDSGDTQDLVDALTEFRPQICLHLATKYVNVATAEDVVPLAESNITFGMRLAHAFSQSGGKAFVYTSTFSQRRGGSAFDPTNLYASTKQAFADILRFYSSSQAFRVLDIQLYDSFGSGDPRPKIWNLLMNAAVTGQALETTEGNQLLNPNHVSDVASALLVACELAAEQTTEWEDYFLPGEPLSLRSAVKIFEEVNNIEIPITWGARSYTGNEMFELWTSGAPLPGWKQTIPIEQGFQQLWTEYNKDR